jgi:acylpyruvate hydrolase
VKIIGIGWNYGKHAQELNNPIPEVPVFFLKADSCILNNNKPFFLPDFSNDVHHEVEIVVKICKLGKSIAPKFAHRYYQEITVGIDFTARDLQNECKKNGKPWAISKSFDGSAPLGKFIDKVKFTDLKKINFHLDINGKTVQTGNTADMTFSIDELISYISTFMTLKTGDLIFTGTPVGVGPVHRNDRLAAYIEDEKLLDFWVK